MNKDFAEKPHFHEMEPLIRNKLQIGSVPKMRGAAESIFIPDPFSDSIGSQDIGWRQWNTAWKSLQAQGINLIDRRVVDERIRVQGSMFKLPGEAFLSHFNIVDRVPVSHLLVEGL